MTNSELPLLRMAAALCSVGAAISAAEALRHRALFRNDGLFAWRLHRMRNRRLLTSPLRPLYDRIFGFRGVIVLLVCQLILSAATLILTSVGIGRLGLSLFCGALSLLLIVLAIRGADGKNGADHMAKMMFLAIFAGTLSTSPWVWRSTLYFITGQLIIAYSTSGWIRMRERGWWNGSLLIRVLRQEGYGNRFAWSLAKRAPSAAAVGSSIVLLFECLSLPALLLPPDALLVFLALGVCFHIANALIIGLNTFFWTFVSAYPAYWFTSQMLRESLAGLVHPGR